MINDNSKYSIINHPLFLDSLFVPTQQLHVKLTHNSLSKHQVQQPIIIPCPHDQISFFQIQKMLQLKIPQAHISQNILPEQPLEKNKVRIKQQQKTSLKQLKMNRGITEQSTLRLVYGTYPLTFNLKQKKATYLSQNRQIYEICLINLSTKSDVFCVDFRWSESIDVKQELISKIKQFYQLSLSEQDVQFSKLDIQLIPKKQIISFRFKNSSILSQQQMIQLIFWQQSNAIYIGFYINTNAFKYRKPVRVLKQQNNLNLHVLSNKLKTNPINAIVQPNIQQFSKTLVIQFQDRTGMRLDYNQLKYYKIKYLLGILRVPNYYKKGLLVFDKLYQPDQYVSDFQFEYMNGDINFVMAIIASQKKLFMNIIDREQPLEQSEMNQLFTKNIKFGNKKRFSLNTYLNQAVYRQDNNQKGQYICQVICDYIQKYFRERQIVGNVWRKLIKTMIQELKFLPLYKHEVFRVVDYECSVEQGDLIEFKNFLVTTRTKQNVQHLKNINQSKKTFFKIKSKTGRSAQNISEFKLDQVIFFPYTQFRITRKREFLNQIEIQMEEECHEEQQYKSNLLIWVDDKKQQGKKILSKIKELPIKYPIILLQLKSNSQFQEAIFNKKGLFQDKNVRKIIITNMTRCQNLENGKLNQIAGVQTLKLVKKKINDPKTEVIFFIGNISRAKQKLNKNGFNPNQCILEVSTANLITILFKLCNWQDSQNIAEQVPQEQPLKSQIKSKLKEAKVGISLLKQLANQPQHKQNPWGNMFSNISN